MVSKAKDIDGIMGASLEALKTEQWDRSAALSLYAIATLMRQGAPAPATPTPVEVQAEAPPRRTATRARTSSAGDADCGDCGERFDSKNGRFEFCFKCGKRRQVLCQSCGVNKHQPQFDACRTCSYGEAA